MGKKRGKYEKGKTQYSYIQNIAFYRCREAGRGFAFLIPGVIAEVSFYDSKEKFDEENIISKKTEYASQVIISGTAVIGLSIWSAIDAVQVSKVNNMYFRDKIKNNVSLKIKPYTNILPDNNVGYGLSLRVNF